MARHPVSMPPPQTASGFPIKNSRDEHQSKDTGGGNRQSDASPVIQPKVSHELIAEGVRAIAFHRKIWSGICNHQEPCKKDSDPGEYHSQSVTPQSGSSQIGVIKLIKYS
jgi:hypothetical protein